MRRLVGFLLVCIAAAGSLRAADKGWVEVRSPHFQVISNGSEKQARQVALEFERIQTAFAHGFPRMRNDSGADSIVVAPRDEATMKTLLPYYWQRKRGMKPAGVFRKGWEKNYAVVRLDQEGEGYATVYHEYIHRLLELNFARLPIWLNEGLAEFFANCRIRDHETVFGLPSPRLRVLRSKPLYPLPLLLAAGSNSPYYRDEDKAAMFYAESWGLTHFLMFGKDMGNGKRMNDLLALLQKGVGPQPAFQQAIGDPAEIQKTFEEYVRQVGFYGIRFKNPVRTETTSAARQMSLAETDAVLAGFYGYFGQKDTARQKVTAALAADPKLWLAHENMAFLYFGDGDDDGAAREFGETLALNPHSYLSLYYQAMLQSKGMNDPESLARLSEAMAKVRELNPRFAPAYIVASRIYARQQKWGDAVSGAVKAKDLEPDRAGYHLNLAQILILNHDSKTAAQIARYVATRWEGPDRSEALAVLQRAHTAGNPILIAAGQAEESALAEYPSNTTAVEGRIESVSCGKTAESGQAVPQRELVLRNGDKKSVFRFPTDFVAGFSDTIWYGADHFSLCHHMVGLKAVVRYKPAEEKTGENVLRWLEIRDDLDLSSPPPAPGP